MLRAYIAGPMGGLPDSNYEAFYEAEQELQKLGFQVINPARHFGGDQSRTRREYLAADLRELSSADLLILLPQWYHSRGALGEYYWAFEMDLPCLELWYGWSGDMYLSAMYGAVPSVAVQRERRVYEQL